MKTDVTIQAETVLRIGKGAFPALRVIPHDEEGKKPRGNAGKGVLLVAREGESTADLLRTLGDVLDQEGSWSGVRAMFDKAQGGQA